jgi:hypothetical protein
MVQFLVDALLRLGVLIDVFFYDVQTGPSQYLSLRSVVRQIVGHLSFIGTPVHLFRQADPALIRIGETVVLLIILLIRRLLLLGRVRIL